MSAVAFQEAVQEFRKWESNQYRIVGNYKRPYSPTVRIAPLPRPKKARHQLKGPMELRVKSELRVCKCGHSFSGKTHVRCHRCEVKMAAVRNGPKRCECGTVIRGKAGRECHPCKAKRYRAGAPCVCGRKRRSGKVCDTCRRNERMARDPYYAEKVRARRRLLWKRWYERKKARQ